MTLHLPLPIIVETPIGGTAERTVRGRDVHAFLEIGKDYSTWIKVQIERARLKPGRDYVVEGAPEVSPQKGENPPAQNCVVQDQDVSARGGRPRIEHHLTLDAAKHVGMLSGTDRGHELREYFLECERRAKAVAAAPSHQIPQTYAEALEAAARLARDNEAQAAQIAVLAPRSEALAAIADAEGAVCVTVAAKVLQMPPSELWAYLRRAQWVYKRDRDGLDVAYQSKITAGYLVHKVVPVETGRGRTWAKPQVCVTPRGVTVLAQRIPLDRPGGLFGSLPAPARA